MLQSTYLVHAPLTSTEKRIGLVLVGANKFCRRTYLHLHLSTVAPVVIVACCLFIITHCYCSIPSAALPIRPLIPITSPPLPSLLPHAVFPTSRRWQNWYCQMTPQRPKQLLETSVLTYLPTTHPLGFGSQMSELRALKSACKVPETANLHREVLPGDREPIRQMLVWCSPALTNTQAQL